MSRLLVSGLLLFAVACSGAGGAASGRLAMMAPQVAPPPIDPEAWLEDVTWLAHDDRAGRDTPSPELLESARYIARAFEEAGLQPLGDDGDWFQHFEVRGRQHLVDGNSLQFTRVVAEGGDGPATRIHDPRLHRNWVPLQTALSGHVGGELVFAGYGISDPHGGYDDYAGLDVKGKVVLVLRGGPNTTEAGTRYAEGSEQHALIDFVSKVNTAFREGAAALLVVNDPLTRPPGSERDGLRRYGPLRGDAPTASLPAAHITGRLGQRIFRWHGLGLEDTQRGIDESGKPNSFAFPDQTARITIAAQRPDLPTVNVLGYLPGSDPHLGGEHLLIGAHMDHLGDASNVGSRGGSSKIGQIHNGADDNASGTSGVINIARWIASLPERPRRGIVFATWSGEEWGLLGARHYVKEPA
ncbi:MAG: M28 family peptidase, partial [Planctomycetota bacterium]